jgi:hypothetical protein
LKFKNLCANLKILNFLAQILKFEFFGAKLKILEFFWLEI